MKKYKYLFLDRDGVINVERPGDYVKNTSEFVFEKDSLKAVELLSQAFDYIFVVTNQRGVGRNVMSLSDLEHVHNYMLHEIEKAGGNITRVYFCTDPDTSAVNRKPNIGMAFQIQRDYPEVDFARSIMVGNSKSDIEFGNKLGMFTILVGDKYKKGTKIYESVNAYYENLYKFAVNFTK
ncbi:D-glycero-alpha-D-manno-heptose-1,7-bisphosphate 7-phosphatase [Dysgonomonas termitidis]|uniref:D,D-heptose 1,7-bisphosphate phosphatase n=1 Tax=Dysgonomonas termitidis TaxID=1516126 RepID=A0ABV9KWC6_9BACT